MSGSSVRLVDVPPVGKRVLRMGMAGNDGLRTEDIHDLDALDSGPLTAEEDVRVRRYGREVKARRRLPYL